MDEVERHDARDIMQAAAQAIDRWRSRLQETASRLESAADFTRETDDPKNLEAAWQGALSSLVDDELEMVCDRLTRAAEWTDDPESWRRRTG